MQKQFRIAAGLMLVPVALAACAQQPSGEVAVVSDDAIEFSATVAEQDFRAEGEMSGYHFIVWEGGRAIDHALLHADVSDVQVLEALQTLGARPGNALQIDSWEQRFEAGSPAPDRTIEGPRVRIEIRVPGRPEPLTIDQILEDPGNRGFDMRFGGHADNIEQWHSGCIVCLYSCPGSKVGNAAYTVRDFVAGASHFTARPGVLPDDGTEVRVRLILEGGDDA